MAFYRCGGGSGIPSQVTTDMNNVLNKKFSTSGQTYPPLEWADDVNLLGMLEEKTASGAIAHIEDGADGVPLKNWLVTLPASLDGYSSVTSYKANTNFFDDKHLNVGLPATTIGSSIDTINTSATRYTYNGFSSPRSNIAIKGSRNDTSVVGACLFFGYSGGLLAEYRSINPFGASAVVIDCSGFDYIRISIGAASGYQAPTDMTAYGYMSAEYGTTFTEYVPANTEQYTAQLGRTIYGGTADIVTGEGEETYPTIKISDLTFVKDVNCQHTFRCTNLPRRYGTGGLYNVFSTSFITYQGYSTGSTIASLEVGNDNTIFVNAGSATFYITTDSSFDNLTVTDFYNTYGNTELIYEASTPETFTFEPITPTPETALGSNNFWADEGDSAVTYRSSGTVTPVVPTLITKSITENGTYDAEDDDADGYSSVTVNVQGGETPFVPLFTETKIADNSSHASSFTLSEDYGNYDMVKIVWWESTTVSGFLYTTPDILDEIFSVGVGKLCINKPSTNYYICYSKSGLTWTQTNQRNIYVHEIYGVTFTNCTMTATDIYKRGASTTTKYAITSQTSLKDYDLFMMASIHATDGSETMPTTWLYQYPKENMSEAFSCPVPTVLQEYNANDEAFVISEYGMTAARFFMVQAITFTPSTSNLLSMGGLTSSNEEPTEPEETENSEEEEE